MIPAFPHESNRSATPDGATDVPADVDPQVADAGAWATEAGFAVVPVAATPEGDVVALDHSSTAVLVAGVDELDAAQLVSLLGRAAAVAGASPADLAADHPGGSKALRNAWWHARTATDGGVAPVPAPALLVLARSVTDDVLAAFALLAGTVHVHLVGAESDGDDRTDGETSVAADAAEASEVPNESAVEHDPAQHEHLRAVVALVGQADLVLAARTDVGARLTDTGEIEVDGDAYRDPAVAANAALGEDVPDGWTAWRFGPDGPFLGEALQEAQNQPQDRPAERAKRPHRRRAVKG
ncbi:hypothetical protein [Litorihabitans aurantiacus]|uniref:RAMA domain-containing protein n=1 Tax=Litorihabitans aurantiacus TaxID=1930061 RepID=A0AA37XFU9_9MICO|nr:hypothetical protein [Litorihabitans aurantiacus]GMA32506.1 hypothetical protein GCM10025875_24980 [Litorihabitans aurantiacus]